MKVQNIISERSGKSVANQFLITGTYNELPFTVFQSYRSAIALSYRGHIVLGYDWDYSTTTGKYRNQFLGYNKKETQNMVDLGHIAVLDLDIEGGIEYAMQRIDEKYAE
jgi:hypothetical protein